MTIYFSILYNEMKQPAANISKFWYLAKTVGAEACESWRTFFIKPEGKTKEPPARMMALDMKMEITSPLEK